MRNTKNQDSTVEKDKGGRPAYEPNDKDRSALEALLLFGVPHTQVSWYLKKSIDTLKKHYPEVFEETKSGREDRDFAVESALFYQAVFLNSTAAAIYWLKCRKRNEWSEKMHEEDKSDIKEDLLKAIAKRLPD